MQKTVKIGEARWQTPVSLEYLHSMRNQKEEEVFPRWLERGGSIAEPTGIETIRAFHEKQKEEEVFRGGLNVEDP